MCCALYNVCTACTAEVGVLGIGEREIFSSGKNPPDCVRLLENIPLASAGLEAEARVPALKRGGTISPINYIQLC